MGKSTALLKLFAEDVQDKRAIVLLDPHGDLIEDALKILPPEARPILLDPSAADYPLAINPVECLPGENPNLKTSALVEMFEALSKGSWGPRLEYILRNTLLLLTLAPNTTLLDLPQVLTNPTVCRQNLRTVKDLELHRFLRRNFLRKMSERAKNTAHPSSTKSALFSRLRSLETYLANPVGNFNSIKPSRKNASCSSTFPKENWEKTPAASLE